jgi:hypothetical protein
VIGMSRPDTRTKDAPRAAGYDEDFVGWTQRTAALLREGRFDEIDGDFLPA